MLDTYQLQVFLAVVETGSYTAAARRLHLTQPAVSRQIRLLQEQLGVGLFRRVGRRMRPSHAGERLVEIARQVVLLSQRVEEEMTLIRGEAAGVLQVAASGTPAWHLLSRLLPDFRLEYPGVGFHLQPLSMEGVARALREGRLDFVLTEEEIGERGLACDLLSGMETVLAAPPGDPWERRKRLALRKLNEVPLILPASGTPARRFLGEFLEAREVSLSASVHTIEVVDPGAALPLVMAGLGVALLPRPLLDMVSASSLHTITLWPGVPWPCYLVRRAVPEGRLEEIFGQFALEKGSTLLR